jgi:hypothetical protein
MKIRNVAAALAALAAALPADAARIVPSQPSAFQHVTLRMDVDSCAFNPATVRVRAEGSTLKVTQRLNQCLVAGTPGIADVQLGALAPGDYRVEVHADPDAQGTPERLAFTVTELAEVAVFPPPPRPLDNYSGLWWNPSEAGWGLSLHQGVAHTLFGAWFVYGASGQPEWYTVQEGRWSSSTRWSGNVYRTTGPFLAGTDFDPRLVLTQAAGTATLDFTQQAGMEDRARFSYALASGARGDKVIQRMAF